MIQYMEPNLTSIKIQLSNLVQLGLSLQQEQILGLNPAIAVEIANVIMHLSMSSPTYPRMEEVGIGGDLQSFIVKCPSPGGNFPPQIPY